MLIWIFMSMDIFVLFVMSFVHFDIITGATFLLLISAGYLTAKALAFFGEGMSIVDFAIAFYIILMIFGVKTFIYYIIAFWFLYKLLFTIVGDM